MLHVFVTVTALWATLFILPQVRPGTLIQSQEEAAKLAARVSTAIADGNSGVTIGTLDGRGPQVFGAIATVLNATSGVYVLDNQALDVRLFSRDGRFVGQFGRSGSGPGEFREPVSVALDRSGSLHVLDVRQSRISVFETETLRHVRDVRTERIAFDMCILGDYYFVLTPQDSALIKKLDSRGRIVGSFGAPLQPLPDSPAPVQEREHINRGRLLCLDDETLVFIHQSMPVLRAFSPEGQLRWQADLRDFEPTRVVKGTRRGFRFSTVGGGPTSTVLGVTSFASRALAIAIMRAESLRDSPIVNEVRIVSAEDGRELYRIGTGSHVFGGFLGNSFVTFTNDPFPHVRVIELSGNPEVR